MDRTRILFLSEENEDVSFLEDVLSSVDVYETKLCTNEAAMADEFRHFLPAIVIINIDHGYSWDLLNTLRDISPATRFLGFGKNPESLPPGYRELFSRILNQEELRVRAMTEVRTLKDQSALIATINRGLSRIVGHSKPVKKLYDDILKAIRSKGATVLIQGESGTGKELVAKAIASVSSNLIAVNCSAITESLFESELFGHARGAFTGAITDRKGLFEAANGGTIFLDEIGDVPFSMQSKLLRVLQEGEIRPIGSNETKKVKVQVIAATNRDLDREIREGRFREDLFYRLNVIPLRVPALRERRDDIPELVRHFIAEFSNHADTPPHLAEGTLQALVDYDWPGNIRELENAIHRATVLMNGNEITYRDIFPERRQDLEQSSPIRNWTGIDYNAFQEYQRKEEREFIVAKIQENGGSVKKTADSFGIMRPALYARANRVGLDLKTLHK